MSKTLNEALCELSRDMRKLRDDIFVETRLPEFIEWLSRKLGGKKAA